MGKDQRFRTGRLLFQTPLLLGGQAARAGISCESCHIAGTDNPHFMLPGMSGAGGTADVTNSFFSALRENGSFDPVAIPDLTKPGKVSHDGEALEKFIRDLIVEEFSGDEPAPDVIAALAFYIRGLRDADILPAKPLTLDHPLKQIDRAILSAKTEPKTPEGGAIYLLLASARHQLGLIHERYPGRKFAEQRLRNDIRRHGQELGRIQRRLDDPDYNHRSALLRWSKLFDGTKKKLRRAEGNSLYDPGKLKDALNGK